MPDGWVTHHEGRPTSSMSSSFARHLNVLLKVVRPLPAHGQVVPGQQRQQPSHCLVVCSFVQLWKTAQFQNDCLHACSFPPQRVFLERRQWICHAFEDGTYDRHEGPESNAASYENRPALSIPQPRLENSHHPGRYSSHPGRYVLQPQTPAF